MKIIFRSLLLATAVASLSACVIHVGGDDRDDSWRIIERRNVDRIEALPMGVSTQDARERLGEPNFIEAFTSSRGDYKVLFYRTHRNKADGDTSKDETTPLVFKDGRLIGYGDRVYQDALVH
jgi:hypothetical protein